MLFLKIYAIIVGYLKRRECEPRRSPRGALGEEVLRRNPFRGDRDFKSRTAGTMLKEKLEALKESYRNVDTVEFEFYRDVLRLIDNLEVEVRTLKHSKTVLEKALEKYADKNFWIRVPPYSLAAADKGEIALIALLQAGDSHDA